MWQWNLRQLRSNDTNSVQVITNNQLSAFLKYTEHFSFWLLKYELNFTFAFPRLCSPLAWRKITDVFWSDAWHHITWLVNNICHLPPRHNISHTRSLRHQKLNKECSFKILHFHRRGLPYLTLSVVRSLSVTCFKFQ